MHQLDHVTNSLRWSALIGSPVGHSSADRMYDCFARESGIKGYSHALIGLPLARPEMLRSSLEGLRALGFIGANITIPFKVQALAYVDEVEEASSEIGAINTVAIDGNRLIGSNTDGIGALRSIGSEARPGRFGDTVVVIGAGGAARSIAFEYASVCRNIIIFNRTELRAATLASDLRQRRGVRVDALSLASLQRMEPSAVARVSEASILIHATPVGMAPDIRGCVLNPPALDAIDFTGLVVFDAIYNPVETTLLREVRRRGGQAINGMGMLIEQGRESFLRWTGHWVSDIAAQRTRAQLEKQVSALWKSSAPG